MSDNHRSYLRNNPEWQPFLPAEDLGTFTFGELFAFVGVVAFTSATPKPVGYLLQHNVPYSDGPIGPSSCWCHAVQSAYMLREKPSTVPAYHVRIKELPSSEQPRERLRDYGPQALSDAELLAILLRVGVTGMNVIQLAQKLLLDHGGWAGLQRLSFEEMTKIHGLGEAKAAQVKAALEIGRRLLLQQPEQRPQITSPADVANLLMLEMSHLDQEHLRVVLLNSKNYVLRIETIYIGTINSSAVRVGEVFKPALRLNAASVIVVHNHPSGDPTPSPEDVAVTRQLVEAGRLLGVEVLDHLVIGQGRWISLRERRLGFSA